MFFLPKGILGINARNLLFIKPFNHRKAILFADDKLKTKHYLSARGINVPKLFSVIRSKEELDKFDFNNLPGSFVIKPNLGSGGEGIIPFIRREGNDFITTSEKRISIDELKEHILDIIDGRFSVNNNRDCAFFEQRIITHDSLSKYTFKGLPDIRVVVFNMIPVMAMLRLPTRESDGKANLQQGAVGIGIDLAKGETTHIIRKYKVIEEIPDIGPVKIKIPYWDQILEMAVKAQLITNLGYLAADICLDQQSGPILLEINARAGLKVQLANLSGLYKRLDRIKGIKVSTPAKGIRIAKDLFGNITEKSITNVSGKKVIGRTEIVKIITPSDPIFKEAHINLDQPKTTISKTFAKELSELKLEEKQKLVIAKQRIKTMFSIEKNQQEDIILGRRDLINFLIDPSKKNSSNKINLPELKTIEPKEYIVKKPTNLKETDEKIYELDKKIKLISNLTPLNFREELEKTYTKPTYNPKFIYKIPEINYFNIEDEFNKLQFDDSIIGQLLEQKAMELKNRFRLIEMIGDEERFTEQSLLNFPIPDDSIINNAYTIIKDNSQIINDSGHKYNSQQFKKIIEAKLKEYKIRGWKINTKDNMSVSCNINKNNRIFIKDNCQFSESRIIELIAHEIETHIFTNENGKLQPYKIFQIGTANYLKTQEGLAIYNQNKQSQSHNNLFATPTLFAAKFALEMSFSEARQELMNLGIKPKRAAKLVLNAKRGMSNTKKPGGFSKGVIYYQGYLQIQNFIRGGGNLKDLYIGKIDLESLDLINTIPHLVKPKYVPHWY